MSLRPVIGVDTGGTKLLAGVVHANLTVGHRVPRLWSGGDRAEVVETMVEAVAEALSAAPDAAAVGFGIPALLDFEAGVAESSVHLPLEGCPSGTRWRSGSGCRCSWTTTRTWRYSP